MNISKVGPKSVIIPESSGLPSTKRECRACHTVRGTSMFSGRSFVCRHCRKRKEVRRAEVAERTIEIKAGVDKILRVSRVDHTFRLRVGRRVTEDQFLTGHTINVPTRLLPELRKALNKVAR